jgi:hypothetical protein
MISSLNDRLSQRTRDGMRMPPLGVLVACMLLALLGAVTQAPAQTSDSSAPSADSLATALKILTDPAGRGALAANPTAAEIDRQVQALAGSPELAREVYALAGQILADLMKTTGGDIGKLMDTLERARTDPGGLAAGLSPQTLQQLSELSAKIEAAKR